MILGIDPIYWILVAVFGMLFFMTYVARVIQKMTRLLEDIKNENVKTNNGTLLRITTEPLVAIRVTSESNSSYMPTTSPIEPFNIDRISDSLDNTATMPRIRLKQ